MNPIEIGAGSVRAVPFRELAPGEICVAGDRLFVRANREGAPEAVCIVDFADATLRPMAFDSLGNRTVLTLAGWTPVVTLRERAPHDLVTAEDTGSVVVLANGPWLICQTAGPAYARTVQILDLQSGEIRYAGDGVQGVIFSDWSWVAKLPDGEPWELLSWPTQR